MQDFNLWMMIVNQVAIDDTGPICNILFWLFESTRLDTQL